VDDVKGEDAEEEEAGDDDAEMKKGEEMGEAEDEPVEENREWEEELKERSCLCIASCLR
jgi:hypothetical protein